LAAASFNIGSDVVSTVVSVRPLRMARSKFSELRKELEARPGAKERLPVPRAET
jgi:hypothetical protein